MYLTAFHHRSLIGSWYNKNNNMERNSHLPELKFFKNEKHFYTYTIQLLNCLYPSATISLDSKRISFKDPLFKDVSFEITSGSLYPQLTPEFRERNPRFSKNGEFYLEEVNTPFKWTGSTGKGYMYPRDRDNFEDTEFGMEQKAYYFIVVVQVVLRFLIQNKK
jgi:hypothetical protein